MSTYTPVASQTLSASASSVTFSNIPQDYTDLVLVAVPAGSTGSNGFFRFRLNSDSGTNYSSTYIYGDGTTAYSARATSATSGTSAGLVTTTLGGSQFTLH